MVSPDGRIVAGKYELLGVLGEGGTGIVYDALRAADKQPVALKVMHGALAGDRQIRGRFQREAAILRRLEGDHVCPILDFGEVAGEEPGVSLLYIALPKIEGPSLADVLEAGPIDVARALDLMLQVLEALKTAHSHGIIHRDLKPANVLIGAGEKAIVVDFGMSKIITGSGLGTTNLTTHNMVFGTPEYMSPEQARGDDLDARCDVYAAGVMLYELLTGERPFTGATPLSVLTAHLTSDLEPPSKRPSAAGRVTPALEAVVMNALARERDERYSSASAFAAALKHAAARPDDVGSLRPAAFEATPPGTDAFAATMPDAIDVTGPTLVLSSAPPARSPSPPPAAPSVPLRRPAASVADERAWIFAWVVVGVASVAVGVWFALRH